MAVGTSMFCFERLTLYEEDTKEEWGSDESSTEDVEDPNEGVIW